MDDNEEFEETTNHPAWPYVKPDSQARFERTYLEDGVTVPFDRLASMPPWAFLSLMTDSLRVAMVLMDLVKASKLLNRRLTASEVESLSEHENTFVRKMSCFGPCSIAVAAAVTWRGRATFRFPLYSPKFKRLNPEAFPAPSFTILRGQPARSAWHLIRLGVYTSVFFPFASFFSFSIFGSSNALARGADPRLASLNRQIKMRLRHKTLQDLGTEKTVRQQAGNPIPTQHDFNPPNGADFSRDDHGTAHSGNGLDGGAYSGDATARASQLTPSHNVQWSKSSPGPVSNRDYPDSRDSADPFGDDVDSTSSLAPSASRGSNGQSPAAQSDSAWDRLRRQAGSNSPPYPGAGESTNQQDDGWVDRHATRERPEKIDADKERQNEQREFDALLEAERHGGLEGRDVPRR